MNQESRFEKLKKEEENSNRIKKEIISYNDFITKELPENKWVIENLIPEGMTILSAAPGQFKTFILLQICKQISNGEMVLNHFDCEKKNILFINEEMGQRAMQDRLKIIEGETGNLYLTNLANVKIDDIKSILEICKEKDIRLVIFDSLTRIHNLSENDVGDVKKIFEAMLILMKENISVIITHHHRKASPFGQKNGSDEMRGSTDLLAQLDCHLAIDNVASDKSYMIMKQLKLRQAENIPDFRIEIKRDKDKVSFIYKGQFSKIDEYNNKIEESKDIIIKTIADNPMITKNKIIELLKGTVGIMAIAKILPALEKEKIIFSLSQKPKKYSIFEEMETLI